MRVRLLILATLLMVGAARADQYRSEVKELDSVPQQAPQKSTQQQLQVTTDPYAKALLLRELAAQAVAKKDYAQASRYLEQALAQKSISGIAAEQMRRDLSQLYLAGGDFKRVLPQLEAQVKAGNAAPETLVALGAAYAEQKRYREAVPLLQKGLAGVKNPDPSWQRALVAALFGAGQEKEALPLLEALLKRDPSQREDWLRLAALTIRHGSKERAQAVMEIANRMGFLEKAEDRLRLVQLTAQVGAPFEAGSLLQSWMKKGLLKPDAANWKLLGGLWIAAREATPAIAALEEALKQQPDAAMYRQLGQLRLDREEYAGAADALYKAVQRGGKDGNTLLALGMARYQQADVDGALVAFRDAAQFAAAKKLAAEWVRYLESGQAREQALAAAAQRRQRGDGGFQLSGRMSGEGFRLSAGQEASVTLAETGGDPYTPIGADRPGSGDGTIPAWTGGLSRGGTPGQRLADPYAADKPLFTITGANVAQYRNRLTPSHQALLARYSTYRIPVYPTRRSVAYPQAIYDATKANVGKAKLLGSDALEGARLGFPFPRPQSGVEVMWNHRTRYRSDAVDLQSTQAVVQADGRIQQPLKQMERVSFRYGNVRSPSDLSKSNILLYYLTWFGRSRNDTDFLVLVHETANSEKDSRDIWVLPPKINKMFRIPPVGYDQPFPGADGLMFVDMMDMYNGAFDRYVWKLTGKREIYVPYNDYRLLDGQTAMADLLRPGHPRQDRMRYELHRVWVIEAVERQGKRHSFGKRVFYVDEDSWNVVLVENYDREGKPWRFQEGHLLAFYDAQFANTAPVFIFDLKDGRYFANRLNDRDPAPQYGLTMRDSEFLPAAVKAKYGR
ncbi:DUF1329 domain-containing protein [Solimonas sp. K1W22B-7]|uniref:DUF1329 domain-containing protein n=1 Tax=Solimonas sp. K1W22B-7 TaxID=2303331 RepID=UPI001F0923E4|nr:DUF1329 domain-containing protein [Solimonas sp. K1W22B-7]